MTLSASAKCILRKAGARVRITRPKIQQEAQERYGELTPVIDPPKTLKELIGDGKKHDKKMLVESLHIPVQGLECGHCFCLTPCPELEQKWTPVRQ
jgi:hypothetical protein